MSKASLSESGFSDGIAMQQNAASKFNKIEQKIAGDEPMVIESISDLLVEAQTAIELYTKSLYHLFDINPPKIHNGFLDEDRTESVVESMTDIHGSEYGQYALHTFFVADIWGALYPHVKYQYAGIRPHNSIPASYIECIFSHLTDIRITVEEIYAKSNQQLGN